MPIFNFVRQTIGNFLLSAPQCWPCGAFSSVLMEEEEGSKVVRLAMFSTEAASLVLPLCTPGDYAGHEPDGVD